MCEKLFCASCSRSPAGQRPVAPEETGGAVLVRSPEPEARGWKDRDDILTEFSEGSGNYIALSAEREKPSISLCSGGTDTRTWHFRAALRQAPLVE